MNPWFSVSLGFAVAITPALLFWLGKEMDTYLMVAISCVGVVMWQIGFWELGRRFSRYLRPRNRK